MAAYEATMRYFDSQRAQLARFHIATSHLTGSAGTDLIFEPAFYYPDAMTEFHLRNLQESDARKYAMLPAVPGASAAVRSMLEDLSRIFLELGAVHQQLGRFYPYADALDAQSLGVIRGIKHLVDPSSRMNPGALGL
jgi:D-lactate dehydrogenase (cytochrome)